MCSLTTDCFFAFGFVVAVVLVFAFFFLVLVRMKVVSNVRSLEAPVWAEVIRKLVDEDYPDKERIVLVMDNLNTHHPASL